MKTIGKTLKDARLKKKVSLARLSEITKIRKEFIGAIEEDDWKKLPEFPVVTGFVKNIAQALGMGANTAAAFLKRDYPPQDLRINPKPDVSKEFIWSPKLTFLLGTVIIVVALFGYLIYQYIRFISPPMLNVEVPIEGQIVNEDKLSVNGKTDLEATIKVNNQPVLLDDKGDFTAEIEVTENTNEVTIVARSRSGKESVVKRSIRVDLGGTE